jgi:hypothetical protein
MSLTETAAPAETTRLQRVEVSPIDLAEFREYFVGEDGVRMMAVMCTVVATKKVDVVIQPSFENAPASEHAHLSEVRTKWIGEQAVVETLKLQELLATGTIGGLAIPKDVAFDRYFEGNIGNLPSDDLLTHGVLK